MSELFKNVGECADDICVIRSMTADVPNHEPSFMLMNCGEARQVRPSMGSWVTYGLGSENQNMPGFITMCPGGYPIQESQNWQSAFLPGVYQGTYIDTKNTDIEKLIENIRNTAVSSKTQRTQLDLLSQLNAAHQHQRQNYAQLEARAFHPARSARSHLRVLAAAGNIPDSRVDEVLGAVGLSDAGRRRAGCRPAG